MFVTFAPTVFSPILMNQTNELSPVWFLEHEDADFKISSLQPKSWPSQPERFRSHIGSVFVYACLQACSGGLPGSSWRGTHRTLHENTPASFHNLHLLGVIPGLVLIRVTLIPWRISWQIPEGLLQDASPDWQKT